MRSRGAPAPILLFLAVVLAACAGPDQAAGTGRDILVLGVLGTSDSESASVAGMVAGVRLAVEEYNAHEDSRYSIQLREFSGETTPGEAGAGESEIVNTERLIGVVGPFGVEELRSLAPALDNVGLSYVVPSVTSAGLPEDGWRGYRRLVGDRRQQGRALAAYAAGRVEGSIAVVSEQSAPGENFGEGAKEALEVLERSASRSDTMESGSTPSTLAAALADSAPELVMYGGGGESGKALVEALRAAGYGGLVVASGEIRELNPSGLGTGVLAGSPGAAATDSGVLSFTSRYEAEFGSPPPMFALEAYEGALMVLEAAEEVQSNPRSITDFLRLNRMFRGDSKYYRFDERGEPVNPPVWVYESDEQGWALAGRAEGPAPE